MDTSTELSSDGIGGLSIDVVNVAISTRHVFTGIDSNCLTRTKNDGGNDDPTSLLPVERTGKVVKKLVT